MLSTLQAAEVVLSLKNGQNEEIKEHEDSGEINAELRGRKKPQQQNKQQSPAFQRVKS